MDPPEQLAYAMPEAAYTKGAPITPNVPSNTGGVITSYTITPALPGGLLLDPASGVIAGTPVETSPATRYTVAGANRAGTAEATVTITVQQGQGPPSGLVYSTNPAVYEVGTEIVPNVPSSAGGAVVTYSIYPDLLPGLALDPSTGVISGRAYGEHAADYTVTASNAYGSATASVRIVTTPATHPWILYQPVTPVVLVLGETVGIGVTAHGPPGSALTYQWYRDGVAIPGATEWAYRTPPADPGMNGARFNVVVSDDAGHRVASDMSTVTVLPGEFVAAGSMAAPPFDLDATRLLDGSVFFLKGDGTAAGYQPDTGPGAFVPVPSPLVVATSYYATCLLSTGKVFIAHYSSALGAASAEIFDPVAQEYRLIGPLSSVTRPDHALTLPDGKVLVLGRQTVPPVFTWDPKADTYDPSTGVITAVAGFSTGYAGEDGVSKYTATLLRNGKVLIAGGLVHYQISRANAYLYDPDTGQVTGGLYMTTARADHRATVLVNGKVLITGGDDRLRAPDPVTLSSAEIFDPDTGLFTQVGAMHEARSLHAATLLQDGTVLITGGFGDNAGTVASRSAEVYHPDTGTFTRTGLMSEARADHRATLLLDGRVLVVGGNGVRWTTQTATAELFDPGF